MSVCQHLEDHLTGMQHLELDKLLFWSVDKVGQNCNVVIFAMDNKHMKLAKDLLDRLFLFLEARFGATVEQAFTDTFTAQQRQDFSTHQGVIMSAADAKLYDEREQQRQCQMENLQDEDSEPEDMDGPTD